MLPDSLRVVLSPRFRKKIASTDLSKSIPNSIRETKRRLTPMRSRGSHLIVLILQRKYDSA